MKVLGMTLVVCLTLTLAGCGSSATSAKKELPAPQAAPKKGPSNQEKIVGTWEVAKGPALSMGTSMEFTPDGKLIMTAKAGGQTVKSEGSYRIDGDTLTWTQKHGELEIKETMQIKRLNDIELVTANEKGETEEFKKK